MLRRSSVLAVLSLARVFLALSLGVYDRSQPLLFCPPFCHSLLCFFPPLGLRVNADSADDKRDCKMSV